MDMMAIDANTEYKNKLSVPEEPEAPEMPSSDSSSDEFHKFADELKQYEEEKIAYRKKYNEYKDEDRKQHVRFVNDLMEYCGIKSHDIHNKIYGLAYENGHAYGLDSIKNHYVDYAELVNECIAINNK